ncbi:hypothetical protein ACFVZR_28225 [Streptomyces sp. NPDC058316]|uniref:hypothetical protein n=1 Tax=unclassified Streptomyces TaxID=2593676 RepID=UPI0034345FCA
MNGVSSDAESGASGGAGRRTQGRSRGRMHRADESALSPVGAIGRVTVPIPPDGPGEVLVAVRGGSEAYTAWSTTSIDRDVRVVVVDSVSARGVIVERLPP